jgi:hypothetical protein
MQKSQKPKSMTTFYFLAGRTDREKQKVGAKSPQSFYFLRAVPFGLRVALYKMSGRPFFVDFPRSGVLLSGQRPDIVRGCPDKTEWKR